MPLKVVDILIWTGTPSSGQLGWSIKQTANSTKNKMSSSKCLHSAVCTNKSAWLQVWFVSSAATFQTFCFGRGFSEAHHLKDKIRLQRWPFPLFGVHFKHLLFVVTRFMVDSYPSFFRLFLLRGAEKSLWEGRSSQCIPQRPHDRPAHFTYTSWASVNSDNVQTSMQHNHIKSLFTCWFKLFWHYL